MDVHRSSPIERCVVEPAAEVVFDGEGGQLAVGVGGIDFDLSGPPPPG